MIKKYITKQSGIKGAGKGLFTNASFKKGEVIGLAHVDDQPASEIGRNHNHNEENPTAYSKKINNKRFIYASRNLKPGEELTTNYRMQPELEQPEDFMREGGALLTKKVTCKSCGWKWDAEDGGNDITTCHKCGGQGLLHAQNGGDTESNGETYKYLGRPDSLYKKSFNGKWLISNKSTGNEFVSIEDPKGSRTKELDKNAVTVSSLNKKRRDHLSKLKKEMDFPKEFINLKDTRKVRATTGEKINPNVDLKADKYNKAIIDNIIKKAKAVGVDPSTMLAIALQETNFGKTDSNLGHVKKGYKGYPYSYIDFYKQKLNEAKFKDELLQIQYYNGLGTVYPETEEDYHGYEMQKIYGVPLPASGINMRKNPLYGKQIIDLRDNVILKNPYIQKALKQKQKGGDNTDAMNGMMKARLAYANEFGNPAAKRMINLPDNPYQFDNGDTGSHYMASMDNYAVPQIQDENGVLVLGDYSPESNEAIRFDSDEDANYFAENYKDVSPGFIEADLDEDEIEEYRKGGYIVEEIDNYQDGGVYTVKGSKGAYKKVNGKWQVDWNRSGKYQPLSKGDVKARTAVLDKMAKPVDNGISKISSNSSDNTRVNNIYQKPLDWSFDPKYKNNIQAFVKKSSEEKEKAIQKEKEDNKIKKGLANNESIKETVGQFNKRQNDWEHSNILNRLFTDAPESNYIPESVGRSPFEDSPMTGIGGAPKMILQAGKWLKPLWTGTKTVVKKTPQGIKYIKNATQPFRQATVSSFKTPLPLGKKITDATGGKLNLGNSVAAYFGADALYNQGDSKSDVVKSQSNFINNPSWNTLGDAAFETGVNSLGLLGLGLGKQVFKPTYNASKKLINNTYKINPWAFKANPKVYYRGIGKSGLDDALESGVFRQAGFDNKNYNNYKDVWYATGNKGFAKARDFAKDYIAEVPRSAFPEIGDEFFGSALMPTRGTKKHIPINEGKILQKDWLKGYKEVPKQYINGGTTNDYVDVDLTSEEIKDLIAQGYVIEELN